MKPINELTDHELASLTLGEIQIYKDLACAEAGVPLQSFLPEEPKKPTGLDPDLTYYRVGDMIFEREVDAQEVASLANKCSRINTYWGRSYNRQFANGDAGDVAISPVKLYSKERLAKADTELEAYDKAMKAWDDLKREHDNRQSDRDAATEPVTTLIAGARDREAERHWLRKQFERYVQLADGNERTAARFLSNAWRGGNEKLKLLVPDIYEKLERAEEQAVDLPRSEPEEVVDPVT